MDYIKLLNKGLKEGYAGGTVKKGVNRGGFKLDSSHFESGSGIYHDEWMAGRVGGGQEIVEVEGKVFTRVYAGGNISETKLKKLKISGKDVIGFLKKQMVENSDSIRLLKDILPDPDGDWQYKYEIIDSEGDIPVTTGKESIFYKNELVFVHILILSPVEI